MNKVSVSRYGQGLVHIMKGLKLIMSRPRLMVLAAIPFVIDLALLFIGFSWGWPKIDGWADEVVKKVIEGGEGFLYSLMYYPLWLIFSFAFVVVLIYGVFLMATIVAGPFNSLLAEETLKILNKLEGQPFSMGRWLKVSSKMLLTSLIKACILGVIGVVLFFVSFIPGLNLVTAFMACLIIAFDNMDYTLEVYEMGLKQRFQFFRENLPEFSGAATFLALTVMVPGLTLLLLPAAVVGSAGLAGGIKAKV